MKPNDNGLNWRKKLIKNDKKEINRTRTKLDMKNKLNDTFVFLDAFSDHLLLTLSSSK